MFYAQVQLFNTENTSGRRHSKTQSIIDERGSKVFSIAICCQCGDKWQIKNSVSNDFLSTFVDGIGVFDCRLSLFEKKLGKFAYAFKKTNKAQ